MSNCDKFLKARCLASFEHAAVGTDAYSQPGAAVLALSGTKHFAEHSKGNVEAQHFPDFMGVAHSPSEVSNLRCDS